MKQLSSGFADHLRGQATTLANCWRLTRIDGTVMGFTDHDRSLTFGGVTYAASTGLTASQSVAAADLSVGGGEVSGALSSAAITEGDIAAGLYDGATVDVYLVNWADTSQTLHIRSAVIGEITRQDNAFVAEVRSLAATLDQQKGRVYQHRCDADLGDARCGIDLTQATMRGTGIVVSAGNRKQLVASGLMGFASGWFARGRLVFTAGSNACYAVEVKLHTSDPAGTFIEIWQPAGNDIAAGDTFIVSAGCDKLIETCDLRFGNAVNFRGFPHIPGSDFLVAHPALTAQPNKGKALVS